MKISLIKISFIITILGMLVLLMILNFFQPKTFSINQLTEKNLNKQIIIQGNLTNIRTINPNFHILTIQDSTSKINAIINNPLNQELFSNLNKNIILTGTLTKYKNEFQIQTNKIILTKSCE